MIYLNIVLKWQQTRANVRTFLCDWWLQTEREWNTGKCTLTPTNLSPNGLCDHQELKTMMTLQWDVSVYACVCVCVCVFTEFPFCLYRCLKVYGCFHGNNDGLSCWKAQHINGRKMEACLNDHILPDLYLISSGRRYPKDTKSFSCLFVFLFLPALPSAELHNHCNSWNLSFPLLLQILQLL